MKRTCIIYFLMSVAGILPLWGGPVQELMNLAETAFDNKDYVTARGYYIDITHFQTATEDQKRIAQHNINLCNNKIAEDNYNRKYTSALRLYMDGKFNQCISACNRLLYYSKYRYKTNDLIRLCKDSLIMRNIVQHKADSLTQINEQLRLEYQYWINKATVYYNSKLFEVARDCYTCSLDSKYLSVINKSTPNWVSRCDSILAYKRGGGIIVTPKLAKIVASATYLGDFSEGKAYIELRDSLGQKKSFIINTDGDIIFNGGSLLDSFHDGYMAINRDFINSQGQFMKAGYKDDIYPYKVERFTEGLAPIMNKKNKWGYIDTNMRVVISPKYDFVTSFSEGYALVRKGRKWAFIDKIGNEVIKSFNPGIGNSKFGFQHKNGNCYFSEGIAWIYDDETISMDNIGNKHLKVNSWVNGNFLGLFIVRDELFYWPHFTSGLCPVGSYDLEYRGPKIDKSTFGFMNKMGDIIIPQIYDKIYPFCEDRSLAVKGSKYGYLDPEGNEIIPIQIPFETFDPSYDFSEGLVKIKNEEGLYGFMNNLGTIIIPFSFGEASSFHCGLAKVRSADNDTKGQYGYVDKFGNSTFDFQ